MSTAELTPEIAIGPESAGLLMTPEEFDAIEDYEPGYRYELIQGMLVVSPIQRPAQSGGNQFLGVLLENYKRTHPEGRAVDDTLPERHIKTATGRRLADRVIWAGLGRLPDYDTETPTVAVEIVSRGKRNRQRDYEVKTVENRDAGVRQYWIIDPFEHVMIVHDFAAKKSKVSEYRDGDVFQPELLPGFEINLTELFAEFEKREKKQ